MKVIAIGDVSASGRRAIEPQPAQMGTARVADEISDRSVALRD